MIGDGTRDFQPRQAVDYAISPKSAEFARLTAIALCFFRVVGRETGPRRLTIGGKSKGIACLT
jgi:hypothetical protein